MKENLPAGVFESSLVVAGKTHRIISQLVECVFIHTTEAYGAAGGSLVLYYCRGKM